MTDPRDDIYEDFATLHQGLIDVAGKVAALELADNQPPPTPEPTPEPEPDPDPFWADLPANYTGVYMDGANYRLHPAHTDPLDLRNLTNVTIDCNGAIIQGQTGKACCNVSGSEGLTIRGFQSFGGRWGIAGGRNNAYHDDLPIKDLTIDGALIEDTGQAGIELGFTGGFNITAKVNRPGRENPQWGEGVYFADGCRDGVFDIGVNGLDPALHPYFKMAEALDIKPGCHNIKGKLRARNICTHNSGAVAVGINHDGHNMPTGIELEVDIDGVTDWSPYRDANGVNVAAPCVIRDSIIRNCADAGIVFVRKGDPGGVTQIVNTEISGVSEAVRNWTGQPSSDVFRVEGSQIG